MASWRELPEDLAPEGRRLIVRMRQLKDRSGLSLTALGRRTSFSSSSWARYLNGQSRPPARAVQELAQECGDDPHRLLAMLSLAEESWPGAPPTTPPTTPPPPGGSPDASDAPGPAGASDGARPAEYGALPDGANPTPYAPSEAMTLPLSPDAASGAVSVGPAHEPASPGIGEEMPHQLVQDRDPSEGPPTPTPRRAGRLLALAAAGAVVGGVLTVGALTLGGDLFGDDDAQAGEHTEATETTSPATDGAPGAFPETGGEIYDCEVVEEEGLLSAGYSTSQDVVLQNGMASWDVVEAQCLLDHHDVSPGEVDGWYGPNTQRAVQRFQERHDLVVDGMVGPHTWGVLRQ